MVEVERKFKATGKQLAILLKNAKLIGKKIYSDTYFDNDAFLLTTNDMWLRRRNTSFELKVSRNKGVAASKRLLDRYEEIEDDAGIRKALKIDKKGTLEKDLEENGISPFCTIVTTRKKYTKKGFSIDVDSMDFGYDLVEIELMVDLEKEAEKAGEKIIDFARKCGMRDIKPKGKVVEYLFRYNRDHYDELIRSGVI